MNMAILHISNILGVVVKRTLDCDKSVRKHHFDIPKPNYNKIIINLKFNLCSFKKFQVDLYVSY